MKKKRQMLVVQCTEAQTITLTERNDATLKEVNIKW